MFSILSSILLNAALVTTVQAAAPKSCPVYETVTLSNACSTEVTKAITTDRLVLGLRKTLEAERNVGTCEADPAQKLVWKYQSDEATGPHLEVSLNFRCDADEGVSGYQMSGKYYLEGTQGNFDFLKLSLDTYE